jgi:hypothetical protein
VTKIKVINEAPGVSCNRPSDPGRRVFLKEATAVAAGLALPSALWSEDALLLPTVALGPYRVTRLIVGGNPIYGYSHFNKQLSQSMLEWFTDERIVKLLLDCEKAGINTWEANFSHDQKRQFAKIRGAGCKIQFICLVASWHYDERLPRTPQAVFDGTIKCAQAAAQLKPLGVAFHGGATDILYRAGKLDMIKSYIDRVHDMGMLAGISVHNPATLDELREKDWPNDFYMAGLYDLTRTPQDWINEFGILPVPAGEGFVASDPPKMCEALRKVKKTTLVYKVLAAGRKCDSSEEVRQALAWAYQNIKPMDAAIVGLYPRYSDQVTETTDMVRAILA